MSTRLTTDPKAFQATAFPFLEQDPVLHTLIMSNVSDRAAGRYPEETEPSYFVSVHDSTGAVVGVAMRTPGRPVYVGALRAELAAEVADAYAEALPALSGVSGDRAAVHAFGRRWTELRGTTAGTESKGTRLHRLEVLTPSEADGELRPMRPDDIALAVNWMADGFPAEAAFLGGSWAERQLAQGTLWFWDANGQTVSMGGYRLPLHGASRVGPIYTPPNHRRHGYAGALTSDLTAKVLAAGNKPLPLHRPGQPDLQQDLRPTRLHPGRRFRRPALHLVKVRATGDPVEFRAIAFPFLQRDPVLHSAVLSNIEDRINGLLHDPAPPVFLSIHDDADEVVGTAFCTAPRGIQLGALPDALVPAIVDTCADQAPNPDVIAGTATAALLLAELLAARGGRTFRQTVGIRLHKLADFTEQYADGAARQAVPVDTDLVAGFLTAYGVELGHPLPPDEQHRWASTRIERGRIWLWEHEGRVVSVVGHQQTLFNATRVGPVYTPPSARGHGYASALTAHVTQLLRATGSEVCLNTDLANPTSNKIYAAIGYRPLADFIVYELS